MEDATPVLIQHIELLFGKVQGGFGTKERASSSVQYVACRGGSVPGVTVISTLGLSRLELASSVSNKQIRQECFFMVKDEQFSPNMPAVLDQIVNERLLSSMAVLHGELLHKAGSLFGREDFVALYATVPVYYPEEMWICHAEQGEVILCWMMPITHGEAHFLAQHGGEKFASLLDQAKCDLFDLSRPSLV